MPYKDKEAKRAYQREWMRKRRETYFKDKSCAHCGTTKRLELDHIEREGKVTHAIWSWTQTRRDEELAKCQVLCESCHMVKTIEQMDRSPHGTHNRYVSGCRCAPCKTAHNRSTDEWRKARK